MRKFSTQELLRGACMLIRADLEFGKLSDMQKRKILFNKIDTLKIVDAESLLYEIRRMI